MIFGRYRLLRRLGAGGMGEVYRAVALGPQGFAKPVVVKQILPSLSSDPVVVRRLVNEAKVLMHLSHRNIVQVFDLGQAGDTYFIAMEFVNGSDLHRLLDRCRERRHWPPPEVAVHITVEVLRGLDYAHRCTDQSGVRLGLIHRDITPANILCSFEGEVRLTDFGLARTDRTRRETGVHLVGTCRYMSPEQARGEDVDQRSDLFSVGSVLYLLLCGRVAFPGHSPVEVLERVVVADYLPLDRDGQPLPNGLQDILVKALALSPADRFQTAGEMLSAVEAYEATTKRATSTDLRDFMQTSFAPEISANHSEDFGDPLVDALLELDVEQSSDIEGVSRYRISGSEDTFGCSSTVAPPADEARLGNAQAESRVVSRYDETPAAVISPELAAYQKEVASDQWAQPMPTDASSAAKPVSLRQFKAFGSRSARYALLTAIVLVIASASLWWYALRDGGRADSTWGRPHQQAKVVARGAAASVDEVEPRVVDQSSTGNEPDHGVAPMPTPHAPKRRRRPPRRREFGYLRVSTQPFYAEVHIGKRKLCETPCRVHLPTGWHTVLLTNPQLNRTVRRRVVVRRGRETRVMITKFK